MLCPVDAEVELVMSERQGVEIDYCPKCRGVWLDRGELDKILDRAVPAEVPAQAVPVQQVRPVQSAQPVPVAPAPAPPQWPEQRYADQRYSDPRYDRSRDGHRDGHRDDRGRDDRRDDRSYGDKKKRKGSWLGDILDF